MFRCKEERLDVLEAIGTRRSVPKAGGSVSKEQVQRLLEAGVRAPCHHLTQPWRFVVLAGDALDELGDAWARGVEREGGDPEKVRDKPRRAPLVICVIEDPHLDNPKVVEVEEHHAVGACMQNILLAAHGLGLGAMVRTGPAAHLDEVKEYLGVKDDELIAGFIYVGQPEDKERPMTRRADPSEITDYRGL